MLTYFLKGDSLPHPHMSVKQIRFCLYVVLVSDLDHVAEQEKAPS